MGGMGKKGGNENAEIESRVVEQRGVDGGR